MAAHQMAAEVQQQLRRMPGNNRCVDCDAPYPQWATVSYGTFMCLECSGKHRGLGVHISFVRSVTMDSWTDRQILHMQNGGNEKFKEAFAKAGVPPSLSLQQKYNTPQAEAYRKNLTALVDGTSSVPMPSWDASCLQSAPSSSPSSSAGGDPNGMEAMKGESEQDYVARQQRLREEARARMQAKFGANGMQGIGSGGESAAPTQQTSLSSVSDFSSAMGFLTSAASGAATFVKDQGLGDKVSSGWSYLQTTISDPSLANNVRGTASTGWSALSSGASSVWNTAQSALQQPPASNGTNSMSNEVPSSNTYNGFGAPAPTYSSSSYQTQAYNPPPSVPPPAPVAKTEPKAVKKKEPVDFFAEYGM